MTKTKCIFQIALIAFVICLIVGCGDGSKKPEKAPPAKGTAENPIVMGFNPAESAEVILVNADALAAALERRTGYKIKTYVAQSYNALVTALKFDDVDFAWLPVFAFVKAEEYAQAEVLLKAVRNGAPYYWGAVVVKSDSPFKQIEDLRGKTIAWVSETSASGYIFPKAGMMKAGINPDEFFVHEIMAGSHDSALLAVVNGNVDAAATFASDAQGQTGSWTQFLKEEDKNKIRSIFVTEPIPADTMSTSMRFHEKYPEIVQKITDAIKEMSKDENDKKILKELYNIDEMIDASSEDYEPVREAARLLDIDVEGPKKKEEAKTEPEKEKSG